MGCFKLPSSWTRKLSTQRLSGRGPRSSRTVHVGQKVPPSAPPDGTPQQQNLPPEKFPDNTVVTSKYTAWNFLPKNLFEQFRRIANFYFLCIAVVQLSIDSPVQPATSVMPLVFVVVVTAIKQAYEDWLRHRADNVVNNALVRVIRQGTLQKVQAKSVRVGDIMMVKADEEFPCDLILLSSSHKEGHCHITTANLDGETNLKLHESLSDTRDLWTIESLSALQAVIECQQPTPDLYRFVGRMNIYGQEGQVKVRSLGPTNLLLKGARLKNTSFIYGCAVYTGQQAKMVLNLKITSNKFSTIEKSMNTFLIVFLILLLLEVTVATVLMYCFRSDPVLGVPWYLPPTQEVESKLVFLDFLSFVVLFNYIIPISLYVTLEMVKFIGAMFFAWDRQLYDEEENEHAVCNTSDLNEELGQVEYLFTDKTGTLTENDMQFRQCSISGTLYAERGGMLCEVQENNEQPLPVPALTEEMERFLLALAICNTVQVNNRLADGMANGYHCPSDLEYQASSPDEKALVEATSRFGVVLSGVANDRYVVLSRGKKVEYRRLNVLEFDSDRKRMSVLVQDEKEEYHLICKGAESSVLARVTRGPKDLTLRHVNDFALQGLRTLVVASKTMSEEEYLQFNKDLQAARNQIQDREEQVAQVCDEMENGLCVLGATAVEDRLQEGVSETLESMRAAGIKVWVLTGDKHETAVQISISCGHIKRGMVQLLLTFCSNVTQCLARLLELNSRICAEPHANYALVVDGSSLVYALMDHRSLLCEVAKHCNAVVCCRMSPLQKAEVVTMIKQSSSRPITAAIGDGANDVSMIQEAHVGLGIMGKEGRQAVRCSDFAFAKFRFLQRVLLVHGHYYYIRVATLVQYFFYKNVAFITPQVIFTFFTAFSPMPLYHSMYLMLFNITFSSLPIIVYGLSEKHIPPNTLLQNPELYRQISCNAKLTKFQFFKWVLQGAWHALVLYFGVYLFWIMDYALDETGQSFGQMCFGTLIYHTLILTVNAKLALHTRYWTVFFVGALAISVLCFEGFSLAYGAWQGQVSLLGESDFYWAFYRVASSPSLWLATLLLTAVALVPDALFLLVEQNVSRIARLIRRMKASCAKPAHMFGVLYSSRRPTHADITVFHISSNERVL